MLAHRELWLSSPDYSTSTSLLATMTVLRAEPLPCACYVWDLLGYNVSLRTISHFQIRRPRLREVQWLLQQAGTEPGSKTFLFIAESHALSRASLVAKTVKTLPVMWETQVQSLGREDLLKKEMATHSSILAWKIPWTMDGGAWWGPWGTIRVNFKLFSSTPKRLHSLYYQSRVLSP